MTADSMRGLFFIVKGQYSKGVEPSIVNKVTGDIQHIGGYDPYSDATPDWYMVLDSKTFYCIACGSNLEKVLKCVYNRIVYHKGVAKNYFKHLSDISSDDYYQTHYLGKTPMNHDQRLKRAEGRCPRTSPVMAFMYGEVYKEYGDYFSEEIGRMEDLAYEELASRTPFKKVKKLVKKNTLKGVESVEKETPKEEKVGLKKVQKKPTVKLGVKKLQMV